MKNPLKKTIKNKKKPVHLSNLAMRFYERDGWTRKELEKCMEGGKLLRQMSFEGDWDYFILDCGGRFNKEKLKSKISKIVPAFKDQPTNIDKAIDQYNW